MLEQALRCDVQEGDLLAAGSGQGVNAFDSWGKTFDIFKSLWKDEASHLKLKMIEEDREDDEDDTLRNSLERRFYVQYIIKGRKILKGDKGFLKDRVGTLLSFLHHMEKRNYGGGLCIDDCTPYAW